MKKEILFVLLKDFADWEGAYIAPNLNAGVEPGSESKYIVKTVSVRKEPVVSIGGFKVLPGYGINDIPADCRDRINRWHELVHPGSRSHCSSGKRGHREEEAGSRNL